MDFTCSKRLFSPVHFAKNRVKIDQVKAELQLAKRYLFNNVYLNNPQLISKRFSITCRELIPLSNSVSTIL